MGTESMWFKPRPQKGKRLSVLCSINQATEAWWIKCVKQKTLKIFFAYTKFQELVQNILICHFLMNPTYVNNYHHPFDFWVRQQIEFSITRMKSSLWFHAGCYELAMDEYSVIYGKFVCYMTYDYAYLPSSIWHLHL